MQGIGGHHGAGQVQGLQELGEVAGLVVLDVNFEMVQQVPAVLGDAEKMDLSAVSAPCAAGGLAIHRHCP